VSAAEATLERLRGASARLRRRPARERLGALRARLTPQLRRRLLAGAVGVFALFAVYHLWIRDMSLFAVDKVEVTGVNSSDAARVRAALTTAGHTMTTLHVDRGALNRAVEGFPVVRELEVSTDFPHGLRVHVVEHHPVAIAVTSAGRLPVAADGTILRNIPIRAKLPSFDVEGTIGEDALTDGDALASAAIAGAAPAELRSRIEEIHRESDRGLVATLRDGPELIFGNGRRLHAKWFAAARVLADLEARGASYVDVRIPGRPAAGGLPAETVAPVAPAGVQAQEPTVAPEATQQATPPSTSTTPSVTTP
jgi:cell division protein FtsQ